MPPMWVLAGWVPLRRHRAHDRNATLDVASATVERLRAVVAEPARIMGTTVHVTISGSLAPIKDGDALAALKAMYAAKRARGPEAPTGLATAPA